MTPDQILKLVEAGFTKADIMALNAAPQEAPKTAAAPEPAKAAPAAKAPEAAPAAKDPEPTKAPDLEGLGQQLQTLIDKQFEEINNKLAATIKAANIPSLSDVSPITDLADIIKKAF